jgi:HEAT repeat protein
MTNTPSEVIDSRATAVFRSGAALAVGLMFLILTPSIGHCQSQTALDRIVVERIQALSSTNFNRRMGAINGLGNATGNQAQCQAAQSALPALLELLTDSEADYRAAALFAIGNIRLDQPELVPPLIAALSDNDPHVRANAAAALSVDGNCAEHAPKGVSMQPELTVPALAAALRDTDLNTRDSAARSLKTYGAEAGVSLPLFIEMLGQKDPDQRYNAAAVIAVIGPDARSAVPPLTAMLRDEYPYIRIRAAAALAAIGANLSQAVPVLSHLLADQDLTIRRGAAIELGKFGAAALPAIPRLTAALNDSDEDMRDYVTTSLKQVIKALVEARRTDAVSKLRDAAAAIEHSPDSDHAALGLDISEAADELKAMESANGR